MWGRLHTWRSILPARSQGARKALVNMKSQFKVALGLGSSSCFAHSCELEGRL